MIPSRINLRPLHLPIVRILPPVLEPLIAGEQLVHILQVFFGGVVDIRAVNDLLKLREVLDSLREFRCLVFFRPLVDLGKVSARMR